MDLFFKSKFSFCNGSQLNLLYPEKYQVGLSNIKVIFIVFFDFLCGLVYHERVSKGQWRTQDFSAVGLPHLREATVQNLQPTMYIKVAHCGRDLIHYYITF